MKSDYDRSGHCSFIIGWFTNNGEMDDKLQSKQACMPNPWRQKQPTNPSLLTVDLYLFATRELEILYDCLMESIRMKPATLNLDSLNIIKT